MKKFLKSFPSVRFMLISVAIGMVVGLILGGESQPRGVICGAILGLVFTLMIATRNYDPDAWEELHNLQAHAMCKQVQKQAETTERLQAVVVAYDKGDSELETEVLEARKYLEGTT